MFAGGGLGDGIAVESPGFIPARFAARGKTLGQGTVALCKRWLMRPILDLGSKLQHVGQ